jgi:hypothetical protein
MAARAPDIPAGQNTGVIVIRPLMALTLSIACASNACAQERRQVEVGIPKHYVVKTRCILGRGFIAEAEAPNHPPALPMVNLLIFNGEVIGLFFEVLARDGWKPWYDEPEGQPVSHGGGPEHYSQLMMFKQGPTAEQCKAAKGAFGG